jgi:flagellar biosynthetic protein FliR
MLRDIAATSLFDFLLIFARLGTAMMLFPAIGGALVAPRIRLLLAAGVSFVIVPAVSATIPKLPDDPISLLILLGSEITIGFYFGATMQLLMAAVDMAGTFMGYSVGLTNALISDPVTEQQSQLITGFLSTATVALLMITNTHHLMFRAVVDSYTLFTPGTPLPLGDFSKQMITTIGTSFVIGLKIAAPLIIFALVFNTGLGLLNRLVPQMQVFFVGMPMQILGGFAVMSLSLTVMLYVYIRYFADSMNAYIAPG